MSDRFAFGNNLQHYQQHSRCALCLSGDDRNPQNANIACNHGASIESALHYLRNYGAPLSPTYGGSAPSYYDSMNNGVSTQQPYAGYGAADTTSPTAAGPSNYYTLTEFLLRMNRMQRESNGDGGGHHYRPPPPPPPPHPSSRHTKPKSEVGCLRECAFCKSNGETAEFYKSHFLKDPVGRVRCPILQRYQCPFCYATGENAHTRRYCPKNPNKLCFMKGGEQVVIKQNLQ